MKTLVIFYSYNGHTKALAHEFASKESASITEIKDIHRPGILKALIHGGFNSIRGKSWPIHKLEADISAYDRLIIFSPIWASNPPPAVNALFEQLPKGKTISVKMVSGSGKSSCRERLEEIIKGKGNILEGFEDIKS